VRRTSSFFFFVSFASFVSFVFFTAIACGKKGPPLPPLVKVPVAPGDVVAARRGGTVDLQFTIPNANTDNTRPANIERVDIYAITAPPNVSDDQILKHGTKIGSVMVKAPRDPDQAVEPGDPDAPEQEAPEGEGLDQGAVAHVDEQLTDAAMREYDLASDRASRRRRVVDARDEKPRPLLGPSFGVPSRTYAAVGISTSGKKGAMSKRVAAPLVPPPPAPAKPTVTYDEKQVTVAWSPVIVSGLVQEPARDDVLPSTLIGVPVPKVSYNVYSVPASDADTDGVDASRPAAKLTSAPVAETQFVDGRMVWGERRCYTVRAVATVGDLTVESNPAAPECTTLTDTFPPAAPKNLQTVPAEGVINLIWEASPEKDLAGYLVYRGTDAGAMAPITPAPISDPQFTDRVAAGVRYLYAVKAVDKAGNASPMSEPVAETAR
jgi:hypothetical protein